MGTIYEDKGHFLYIFKLLRKKKKIMDINRNKTKNVEHLICL